MKKLNLLDRQFILVVVFAIIFSPFANAAPNLSNGRAFYDMQSKTPAGAIRVNLLGGVAAPGRYFVPEKTKLIDLLTIAGGVRNDHDLENLRIKRINANGYEFIGVNLNETLTEAGKGPIYLQERDTIHIPSLKPLIDRDSSAVIGLVTSILSITLTGFVLQDRLRK